MNHSQAAALAVAIESAFRNYAYPGGTPLVQRATTAFDHYRGEWMIQVDYNTPNAAQWSRFTSAESVGAFMGDLYAAHASRWQAFKALQKAA